MAEHSPAACFDDHCITCGDEGIAMQVVAVDEVRGLALCEEPEGARSTIEIGLVDAAPGDRLLVHAGTALVRLESA
ncbi:MAG TPA: HypC/HybG/HupF family hydrogenase formation chaperone [Solirubrobacterales bacterium]|nr:HypC/HybG/HupF family hydrogenase formation chaperone [Solirubrobacterales bacterium]